MARKLPPKDVVIIGLGWTGSILGYELAKAGLDVVAIERGPWRYRDGFSSSLYPGRTALCGTARSVSTSGSGDIDLPQQRQPIGAAYPQLGQLSTRQCRTRRVTTGHNGEDGRRAI